SELRLLLPVALLRAPELRLLAPVALLRAPELRLLAPVALLRAPVVRGLTPVPVAGAVGRGLGALRGERARARLLLRRPVGPGVRAVLPGGVPGSGAAGRVVPGGRA
ncbi:hypothetical protein NGM37_47725, partial [Streptomyces sp. TRM76130]|nr:hypothetical protein [Streptomyces sp. TRM76130]